MAGHTLTNGIAHSVLQDSYAFDANGSAGFVFIHTDTLDSPVARTNTWGGLIWAARFFSTR